MINQTIQQTKSDPKGKAITSLVLGIINVALGIGSVFHLFIKGIYIGEKYILEYIYIYGLTTFLAVNSLICITGIILGKMGLKSTKKGIAIAGIVLSIIGLLGSFFFWFFIKAMEKGF